MNKAPVFPYKIFFDMIIMLMKRCVAVAIVTIIITFHHIITPIIKSPCYRTREMLIRALVVSTIYYRFLESVSNGKSTILRVAAEDSNLTATPDGGHATNYTKLRRLLNDQFNSSENFSQFYYTEICN